MLKSFELRDRERPLTVHGPPGTSALLERLRPVFGRPRYGLTLRDLEPDEHVRRGELEITPFAVRHRGVAFGYTLFEDDRPGRLDAALAEQLGVTPGPDFGRLQRGETVAGVTPEQVVGETRAGRRIVVSGDTAPTDAVVVAAHGADVLVHEATFLHEDADRAQLTLHSTARQAALVAADAEVRLLVLTHLSSRYAGGQIRDEARAVFADTEVPRDFDTIEVPFPEKGPPVLERWDPARPKQQETTPA
jgi:ribonuclease Z